MYTRTHPLPTRMHVLIMCTHVYRWDWGWQVNSDWLTLQDQLSRWEENNNLSTHHMPSRPLSLPLSLSLSLSLPLSLHPSFTDHCSQQIIQLCTCMYPLLRVLKALLECMYLYNPSSGLVGVLCPYYRLNGLTKFLVDEDTAHLLARSLILLACLHWPTEEPVFTGSLKS